MPPKKKDKEGKKAKPSLYINQTPYKFGCLCTFCNKQPATLHCAECPDFFCAECDVTAHSTKKRATHTRQVMSKLDLKKAAGLVTRYTRLVQHLKRCIIRCRAIYRRYFDSKTLCHYYYNSKYGYVTWVKPYCLRLEELYPFFTEFTGATKIQCMYHLWKSRIKINANLHLYYRKIFDRTRGRFYYTWLGKSTLVPKSNWKAPFLFTKRGYPYDIKPIFTRDAAVVVIQRQWRTAMIRKMMHALVRGSYEQIWDPVSGSMTYYHRETEILYKTKPALLGSAPWDPNFIPGWGPPDVFMFLRRIGFKAYAKNLMEYGIDGKALLLIDDEDFENLDIMNKIHRKKIKVEVFKRYPHEFKERASEEQSLRREAIRKLKLFTMASKAIQSVFRGYLARKEVWLIKEMKRLGIFEAKLASEVKDDGIWWSYRNNIPSLMQKPYNAMNFVEKDEVLDENGNPIIKERGVLDVITRGDDANFKLPSIQMKLFGRKRDHKNVNGWGRKGETVGKDGGDFKLLDLSSYMDYKGRGAENFQGMDNPSRAYSTRLVTKGYDIRRFAKAKGEAIPDFIALDDGSVQGKDDKPEPLDSDDDEEEGVDDTFGAEDEKRAKAADKKIAAAMDAKSKAK
jgi:hypothetical protein